MELHWHAYVWDVQGKEIKDEYGRDDNPGFESREHPVHSLTSNLKKSRRLIRGTFTDPDEALAWLTAQYHALPVLLNSNYGILGSPVDDEHLAWDRATLLDRGNLVWSFWTLNVRRISMNMISCPTKNNPLIKCPLPSALPVGAR